MFSKFTQFLFFPPNKKYLIVDRQGSEVLFRNGLISKFDTHILDMRRLDKFLNFWVIVYGIIRFLPLIKKSKYAWIVASTAALVKPKFVITFMDYILHFYLLKEVYPQPTYISIQVGRRAGEPGTFFDLVQKKAKTTNLTCDYILTYSNSHASRKFKRLGQWRLLQCVLGFVKFV